MSEHDERARDYWSKVFVSRDGLEISISKLSALLAEVAREAEARGAQLVADECDRQQRDRYAEVAREAEARGRAIGVDECVASLRKGHDALYQMMTSHPVGSDERKRLSVRAGELYQAADKLTRAIPSTPPQGDTDSVPHSYTLPTPFVVPADGLYRLSDDGTTLVPSPPPQVERCYMHNAADKTRCSVCVACTPAAPPPNPVRGKFCVKCGYYGGNTACKYCCHRAAPPESTATSPTFEQLVAKVGPVDSVTATASTAQAKRPARPRGK